MMWYRKKNCKQQIYFSFKWIFDIFFISLIIKIHCNDVYRVYYLLCPLQFIQGIICYLRINSVSFIVLSIHFFLLFWPFLFAIIKSLFSHKACIFGFFITSIIKIVCINFMCFNDAIRSFHGIYIFFLCVMPRHLKIFFQFFGSSLIVRPYSNSVTSYICL